MKFGKRRQETQVPGVPGETIPTTGKSSKRRRDSSAAPPPAPRAVTDNWTAPLGEPPPAEPVAPGEPAVEPLIYAEPVVEGEAVELPAVEPAAPVYEPPAPLTLQGSAAAAAAYAHPIADQPVTVAASASGPRPAPVSSLSNSGEAFASGHAAAPGPSWQEPLIELTNERPEIVVGAAFAGGIIAAMILRRLGN